MLEIVLMGLTALIFFPSAILAVEILAASVLRSSPETRSPSLNVGTVAVIVPAHNEEAGLPATLENVAAQLRSSDRLVVVADNCTDNTAAIARAVGAEVAERWDPDRRGKGYALDWGLRYLKQNPPDIVVIIDADCRVASGTILTLAQNSVESGRPTQALYAMKAVAGGPKHQKVQEFAWTLKNSVRPLGLAKLGLPCQLMGSGMAFPWSILTAVNLASDHLVEDVKLGLDLAARGWAPLFCPSAYVESTFPVSEAGVITQRRRWEMGSMHTLLADGPRYLWHGLKSANGQLVVLALDLMVPPLSLLGSATALLWMAAAAAILTEQGATALVAVTIIGLLTVASLLLGWVAFGRQIISAREAWHLVGHLRQKFQIHLRRPRRSSRWIRTDRS